MGETAIGPKVHIIGESKKFSMISLTSDVEREITRKFISFLQRYEVRLILVESSGPEFSFSKSWNKGIMTFNMNPTDYVLFSHDDVSFTDDNFLKFLSYSENVDGNVVITPIFEENGEIVHPFIPILTRGFYRYASMGSHIPPFLMQFLQPIRQRLSARYFQRPSKEDSLPDTVPHNSLARFLPISLMSADTLRHIGLFDESLYFGEDIDFEISAYLHGVSFLTLYSVKANHIGSYSVGKRENKGRKEKYQHLRKELIAHSMISKKYGNAMKDLVKRAETQTVIVK